MKCCIFHNKACWHNQLEIQWEEVSCDVLELVFVTQQLKEILALRGRGQLVIMIWIAGAKRREVLLNTVSREQTLPQDDLKLLNS